MMTASLSPDPVPPLMSSPQVSCVVLDEADKMLSLGFKPQLDRLLEMLLANRAPGPPKVPAASIVGSSVDGSTAAAAAALPVPQVLLFTATMPAEVDDAAARWLKAPVTRVTVTHSAASISRTITQV